MDPLRNFGYTTVSVAPSPALTGTTIQFAAPSVFPDPTADGAFNLVVWPAGVALALATNAEIIRCTALAAGVFTISRAQEGSSARVIVAGDQVALAATAKTFTDLGLPSWWTLDNTPGSEAVLISGKVTIVPPPGSTSTIFAIQGSENDWAGLTMWGDSTVSIQGDVNAGQTLLSIYGDPAQTQHLFETWTGAGDKTWGISKDGYEFFQPRPIPADGDLGASQRFHFYDATPGAACLRFKQKDAAGAVSEGIAASFDTSRRLLVGVGTPSQVGLGFLGDPDTGIYSPAAGRVAMVGDGVERFTLGQFGRFTLNTDQLNIPQAITITAAGNISIGSDAGHLTEFFGAGATPWMRVLGVGIRFGDVSDSGASDSFNITQPTAQAGQRLLRLKGASGQSADFLALLDDGGATLTRFAKSGHFMTRKTAAPADGDLASGEMALWFDSTSGAAKLMVKAKQADGTVRTGNLALA